MINLAAMVVIMTCTASVGSTQDACSYAEPQTYVYVTPAELKECADGAQDRNELYEYLRAKKLNGDKFMTARCEVVNMDAHDDSVHQAPEKAHRSSYTPADYGWREWAEGWTL